MQECCDYRGRRALVTGGSRGIGKAIAEAMLHQGAEVCIVARDPSRLHTVIEEWRSEGLNAHGWAADVSTLQGVDSMVSAAHRDWTSLDIFVHCAGTNIRKKSVDYDTAAYDTIMRTNTWSAFELSRRLHPLLVGAKQAAVLFIASTAGLTMVPTGAPYAMSKAALDHLTRYLAVEWASDGIRVNSIAPWYINTPLVEEVLANPEWYDRVISATPMGRIGEAKEVAAAAVFLCSHAASYITGQHLAVDGGFLARGL
jgi:tropinone reductase I